MANIEQIYYISMKLYELDINGEDSEVFFNSIVNIPAHLKVALKFNEDTAPKRFAFNEDKQIISGVMIAVDEPIYRYNPETKEEFNVIFRKSVADKIIRDYMKKGYANNVSFDHNEQSELQSAYLLEMYQIDESRGNSVPKAFEGQNLQDGSIIASYHIEDAQEWEAAKQRGGFSVEGVFDLIEVNNQNLEKMSLLEKLGLAKPTKNKQTFSETAQAFAEATLEDGTVIYWDGELNEGVEIFVDVDGVMTPAPDGTHVTNEGLVIETVDGVATSISMPEEAEEVEDEFAKNTNNRLTEIEQAIEMLKESYDSKFAAQEATITKQANEYAELSDKFEAIKKIAPAPTKEKFAAPKVKAANVKKVDILAMARATAKN